MPQLSIRAADRDIAPIRAPHFARLAARHRPEIAAHLAALDDEGRALRFGGPTNGEAIARYVATIDFERDIVEGVFEDDRLVGVAHLAVYTEAKSRVGEVGISVSSGDRHRHLGQRLLSRVVVRAVVMGLARIHVLFAARNCAMAHLALHFADDVASASGEAHATIELSKAAA